MYAIIATGGKQYKVAVGDVIKILEVTIFKKNDSNICELYTNSLFMKDISVMRFFINVLEKYTNKKLGDNKNVDNTIIKFTYSIMEHTLNMFESASKEIKDKQLGNQNVKIKLTNYSTSLVNKMLKYLGISISLTEKKYKDVITTLDELKVVEDKLENKIFMALNDSIKLNENKINENRLDENKLNQVMPN